ncbi:zf-TFIIB domain-containing protein [Bythopirellula goksoeyrii]|uniref:Transcription factor zinc-finger domain-containing protein n=1 Tax=Bythopirellula goksoeyrii TaxID=1400387 RepID=A0A5B9QL14_9BACT|nr:zf-TFIIB domain-containing protein [Bythopirellula goksoeyrii]QEG34763.1 hypothetical protein Pr1d_20470 [Bythopirellula goksoeyrii]
MKCPRDESQLARAKIDGIRLHKCLECSGIWLEFHKLEAICGLKLSNIESHIQEIDDASLNNDVTSGGYMRCPRCPKGRLQKVSYTFMHPIRIDRCNQCLGCWVDKGELDAIVQEKTTLDEQFSESHFQIP